MTDITPPASADWYDLTATVDAVLAVLRLSEGDIDEARIAALVPVAAGNIDAKVDRDTPLEGPPPSPWAQTALELETVALYRAQTADIDPYVALGGAQRSRDVLVGGPAVSSLLRPYKARWGVA
jgi:hypothetical protein